MDQPADPVEPAAKPSSGERERLDLLDVALFVRAALPANVSAAGREFGLSAAVASSRIAQLERLLGARLLHRTTRRISLTQDGEVFMTRAQALLDAADAARMLRSLSGREHQVHTAFALRIPGREALVEEQSTTRVRFYELSDAEIAEYVATGEPMDKAGAYGIQGRAAALVESIDGDFYTVMGFPLARFVRTLRALGFSLPIAKETPSR